MNEEQQRIAIAEACGFKAKTDRHKPMWATPDGKTLLTMPEHLPDYLNDLNAMREALLTLPPDAPWNYYLSQVVWEENPSRLVTDMDRAQATAAQQARAFLEIKKLWKQ
jgi:hypothetical protein